jgi:acetolactate synthase-1/2/3 large subunit
VLFAVVQACRVGAFPPGWKAAHLFASDVTQADVGCDYAGVQFAVALQGGPVIAAGSVPSLTEELSVLVMGAIAEILRREGIELANCYPTTPLIEAMAAAGIRPILCRQERAGVDAAAGYARVTNGRTPGVFAMQFGPGAENAFAGVASAFSDSAPVLLLPLGHERDRSQQHPLFSSRRTYASVTKFSEELLVPGEVAAVMRRAFNALKNGRPGPALVEIPSDVVTAEIDGPLSYEPVRAVRAAGDPAAVDDAARVLVEAARPVIQAGQGALYAEASDELVELAVLLGAPVLSTLDGKSAFPEDHPLSLGAAGPAIPAHLRHFLLNCDVVLAVGCSLTRHPMYPSIPGATPIVHLTNDPSDLYKTYEDGVPLLGDAKLVLRQLIDAVSDRLGGQAASTSAVTNEISQHRVRWLEGWLPKLTSSEVPMTPYRVIHEFMQAIEPADAIVTHDSGSPRDQLSPFYRATRPRGYIGWGKSHQLGTGLGLAIGAKLAAPDKLCVNFMGDAAFGMTGLDFETSVRCQVPILTIVLNNSTMAIETQAMTLSHERYRTRDIGGNYAAIARELGGHGERIVDPNEIADAIVRARRLTEEGTSVLLEFITSSETAFSHRRDSAFFS